MSIRNMKGVRHQGRVVRLHFECHAEVPFGTSLRVTSSIGPPLQGTFLQGAEAVASKEDESDEAPVHSRLLPNSVEMFTSPESYPLWRTAQPVVVVDDGQDDESDVGKGPLIHRYRYVAVTPGAEIDWDLCARRENEDDASSSMGRNTVSTTPPPSEDEKDADDDDQDDAHHHHEKVLHYDAHVQEHDDHGPYFPPVLFENPSSPSLDNSTLNYYAGESSQERPRTNDNHSHCDLEDLTHKRYHKRSHSLFDAQGNPIVLSTRETSAAPSTSSATSFSSEFAENRPAQVLTWDAVSALPYRTRVVDDSEPMTDDNQMSNDSLGNIDHWNNGADPSFQSYWNMKRDKIEDPDNLNFTASGKKQDDYLENIEKTQRESLFIVCYHLPVILTRNPTDATWSACWSESLISKSEMQSVSSTKKTTWIGTVSNIPAQFLADERERNAIQAVLKTMDCLPIFFIDENSENILDFMYLGFCKQVLWPSFHNVDLLDMATNGWGQRQSTVRTDLVQACALAAAEARERKRSGSVGSVGSSFSLTDGENSIQKLRSDWDQGRLDRWWEAYQTVNRIFSQVVAELVSGGDIVWVHDYHLALMPRMLREARNETDIVSDRRRSDLSRVDDNKTGKSDSSVRPVKMVFFIHVPFPTSQVFRELEHGEALLEGMLHADVIGFHAFDHARHFLNAAKRILGLSYETLVGGLIGVRHRGTKVLVTVSNVSIETDVTDALLAFPSVQEEAKLLQKKHEGRTIIAGIDVAQRLSGVNLKLLAFERLLTDYPVWQSKVVLLQRCLIPGNRRVDEADTLREVRSMVQRIKSKFGTEVIDYGEQVGSNLPIDQRLAIWTSSQVLMHTPVREGLNFGPLEFVYARKEPATPGVVIASEFSAVSSILNGALRVNPWDVLMCVTSIDCALSMSMNERDSRRGRDIDFVSTCPSGLWTRNVLRDLNDATQEDTSKMKIVGDGSPESLIAHELELGLERLDVRALESAYASTKNRVIIIDFNGTLVAKEPPGKYLKREILGTSGFKPSPVAAEALARLCRDQANIVYVVSGDSQQNLEVAVGDIPGLGLAASNGACFADPGGGERSWQYLDFGVDWNSVKKAAMPIISKYTARTNGSFVKLTHSSIGWSYYSCDPEWGSLQASHLVLELTEALHSYDVRFVALKGIVEVVPRKLNKGQIVKKVLQHAQTRNNDVDFVLCMGDDVADEKMFTSVLSFTAEYHNTYAFNVAVGKKPTIASFFVDNASDVAEVLVALSRDTSVSTCNTDDTCMSEEYFS